MTLTGDEMAELLACYFPAATRPIPPDQQSARHRLDPQATRKHRREQRARSRNDALIVEHDARRVGRPFTMQLTP
jgi:hypothetical protein